MELPAFLLPLALVSLFVGVTLVRSRSRGRRVDDVWAKVAEQLGGSFRPRAGHGFLTAGSPRQLAVTIEGVDLAVEHFEKGGDGQTTTYTLIRAAAAAPGVVSLEVSRKGALRRLADAVGLPTIEVGDRAFDDAFQVESNDSAFARAWLNPDVRGRLSLTQGYTFRLWGGQVTAHAPWLEGDGERLVRTMRALAAFADGRQHALRSLRELAAHLGGRAEPVDGGWGLLTAEVGGTPVRVEVVQVGAAHFQAASALVMKRRHTPFLLTRSPAQFPPTLPFAELGRLPEGYTASAREPARAAACLTTAIRRQIEELLPTVVRTDEEQVMVLVQGTCPPLEQTRAAIELARAIAASADEGPYR